MASTLNSLFWKFSERGSVQIVSLIINIILARILTPEDYGIVAMVAIFISLSYVIVDGGFNSALIQKKNADILDFSSVFYFTLIFSIILYIVLFLSAPCISNFYNDKYPQLTDVLRVLGLQVVIYGINSIQVAYVSRKMMFKNLFLASLIGTVLSAIIGIIMAYTGFGIWAIVTQQLINTSITTLVLYVVTRKLPSLCFSYNRLKSLLNYGVKLFASSLIINLFQELRAIIIGKIYSAQDLALYDRGRQFPALLVNNVNNSIGAVLFPVISRSQDNMEDVKNFTRKSIRFSSFVLSPLMFILAVSSEPIIRLVLTEKWIGCVPLMQWFCLVYLFQPIHTANLQALKAIGRSDTCLKLEIVKKLLELITLLLVMNISVKAIVINMALLTTLFTIINAFPNRKILDYTYSQQSKDILPSIGISLVSCLPIVAFNSFIRMSDILQLIVCIPVFMMVYISLSKIFNSTELEYICKLLYKRKSHA